MKGTSELTVARSGAVYIGKLATKELGIYGYKWAAIQESGGCFFVGIHKSAVPYDTRNDYTFLLHGKSGGKQAMTGGCRKFADKLDFGDADSLDLQFAVVSRDDESVLLRIDRPGFAAEEATGREEKAEANEEAIDKDNKAKVARWIRANGCGAVVCDGMGGRFDGTFCPLIGGHCTSEGQNIKAEEWLIRNGYPLDQETPLGTVSKPANQQLDMFDLPGSKAASSPRTRPLPDGLPEWLRGPLSRGEQVLVAIGDARNNRRGWAVGVRKSRQTGSFIIAVDDGDSIFGHISSLNLLHIHPLTGHLKSVAECLSVAKELGIGLSPMQIKAIISGGVPPEDHGLPDEMFE